MKFSSFFNKQKLYPTALLTVLFFGSVLQTKGQCNCTFTIPANAGYYYFDGASKGVKAGDVICVQSGSNSTIQFVNVKGAANNPVVIRNCGGQVLLGGPTASNGMLFNNSRYVHVTGTGDAGVNYGFKVIQTVAGSQGLAYAGLSSDLEVDHMEIANAGYTGIMAKTDPSANCADVSAVRPNFTLYNVSIHDNYIHDSGGEGIYLGDSFYNGTTTFCGSMQYCHEVKGVRIFNNRFENTGRESIQVGSGTSDIQIYNNKIYNYGTVNLNSQNGGVQLGVGTVGRLYNNFIKGGTGPAIAIQGIGGDYVYNNFIINPGQEGITVNTRPTPLSTDIVNKGYVGGVYVINNTFVGANHGAIIEFVNAAPGNVLYNNLIVASSTTWDLTYTTTDWKKGNNLAVPVLSNAKFVNSASDDYHLASGSPALNAGKDVASYGVTFDADNKNRPFGTAFDIGAYEFSSGQASPAANAGTDKTITLPINSVALPGSASDADGTITAYSWTKQSGPLATLAGTTTSTLTVSSLTAGTYVFRLTATDNTGLTGFDDVTVTVNPGSSPIVNAGADKILTLPTNSVTLAGTASDPDGTIASYVWTKLSGPAATLSGTTTASLVASSLVAGTYVFRLTATDNTGLTGLDDVTVTVSATGQSPVVNAGPDLTLTLPSNSFTITATASDPDGTIAAYAWTKVSGPAGVFSGTTAKTLIGSSLVAGVYVFSLQVTDNSGLKSTDTITITVNGAVSGTTVLYRINAGGGTIIDSPINWSADTQQSKSPYLDPAAANYSCGTSAWPGSNNTTGAPDALFGPNRYQPINLPGGQMKWSFPVASGTYEVRLYFAETPYAGGVQLPGLRKFNVIIEGGTVLSNYDIFASVGMGAVKKVFQAVVSDGMLNINFVSVIGNPQVNGIEIVSVGGGSGSLARMIAPPDVDTHPSDGTMSAYPNPFHTTINVPLESEQPTVMVSLVDLGGHVVYREIQNNVTLVTVDLTSASIPEGTYILVVKSESLQFTQRVIKR